jgi:hypothetical protein
MGFSPSYIYEVQIILRLNEINFKLSDEIDQVFHNINLQANYSEN